MSKFIKLGGNVIQVDSLISAQYIDVEYPFIDDGSYNNQKGANLLEDIGGIGTILGSLLKVSNVITTKSETKVVKLLLLQIFGGSKSRMIWVHNDKEFDLAWAKIKETHQAVGESGVPFHHSDKTAYEKACENFYLKLRSIEPTEKEKSDSFFDFRSSLNGGADSLAGGINCIYVHPKQPDPEIYFVNDNLGQHRRNAA